MDENRIKFNFHFGSTYDSVERIEKAENKIEAVKKELKDYAVEKTENGKKKRYLFGVASGLGVDAHKEAMSDVAVKGMLDQAKTSEILLFPDVHGIKQSEDIGRLTDAYIDDLGDWHTKFRLYDENDDVGQTKLEKINNIWKQINGEPPYEKPIQMGFSVEGIIPNETGYLPGNRPGLEKIINKVDLDGVCLVPRPAYQSSIAHSVCKALNIQMPHQIRKEKNVALAKRLLSKAMIEANKEYEYWQSDNNLDYALREGIDDILLSKEDDIEEKLDELFKIYVSEKKNLILNNREIIMGEAIPVAELYSTSESGYNLSGNGSNEPRKTPEELVKSIAKEFQKLTNVLGGQNESRSSNHSRKHR